VLPEAQVYEVIREAQVQLVQLDLQVYKDLLVIPVVLQDQLELQEVQGQLALLVVLVPLAKLAQRVLVVPEQQVLLVLQEL
jgi:hypothetical protein